MPDTTVKPEPYVTRHRSKALDGWRYLRKDKITGQTIQASFSCKRLGGELPALLAANDFARSQNSSPLSFHTHIKNARNQFGIAGINLKTVKNKKGHIRSVFWTANWVNDDGTQSTSSYSVLIYGYEGAYLNAAWDRLRAVDFQPNLNPNQPPPAPQWLSAWLSKNKLYTAVFPIPQDS